ncbi:MAG: hypothetical protein PHC56_10860 [Herbinix sp.]|nr:hypothetical protein [Herbinix sp.]
MLLCNRIYIEQGALKKLTPYAFIGDTDPEHQPALTAVPDDINIAVFDEKYVEL